MSSKSYPTFLINELVQERKLLLRGETSKISYFAASIQRREDMSLMLQVLSGELGALPDSAINATSAAFFEGRMVAFASVMQPLMKLPLMTAIRLIMGTASILGLCVVQCYDAYALSLLRSGDLIETLEGSGDYRDAKDQLRAIESTISLGDLQRIELNDGVLIEHLISNLEASRRQGKIGLRDLDRLRQFADNIDVFPRLRDYLDDARLGIRAMLAILGFSDFDSEHDRIAFLLRTGNFDDPIPEFIANAVAMCALALRDMKVLKALESFKLGIAESRLAHLRVWCHAQL